MICPSCGAANDDAAEVCFTCRAVLSALTQGSIVGGRYEILSPLGRGGMGAVSRCMSSVATGVSPRNGTRPVNSSKTMIPSA